MANIGIKPSSSLTQAYTISNTKVYTSYFNRATKIVPDHKLISIALWAPEDYSGSYMKQLAPPYSLMRAYKLGYIDKADFIDMYYDIVLDQFEPQEVYEAIRGKVICCWEKPSNFWHRHIVSNWLALTLGQSTYGGEL